MAAGSIVEKGTHSELIALRGAYFKLVEAQSASQPDYDEKFDESASDSDVGSMDDIDLGEKEQETALTPSRDVQPEAPKYGLWTLMKLIASLNRQEWKLMAWGCFWSLVCGAGNPTNAYLLGKQIMVGLVASFQNTRGVQESLILAHLTVRRSLVRLSWTRR